MNLKQWHAKITDLAAQVTPDTRHLPAGMYVLVVENCLDCALTPVSTCHNCGGGGELRYWLPFRDVLAQELATVLDLLAATRPDVAQAVREWEVANG